MPVENTQFVIHHGIDGFIKKVHGQEMPGSINHESAINESGLVLDDDGKHFLGTFLELVPGTLK